MTSMVNDCMLLLEKKCVLSSLTSSVFVNDPSCTSCPWSDVPLVLQDREDMVLQMSKLNDIRI